MTSSRQIVFDKIGRSIVCGAGSQITDCPEIHRTAPSQSPR